MQLTDEVWFELLSDCQSAVKKCEAHVEYFHLVIVQKPSILNDLEKNIRACVFEYQKLSISNRRMQSVCILYVGTTVYVERDDSNDDKNSVYV